MFRLHCNKCYRNRNLEPALTFHFSRCHHILCANCLNDAIKDQECPLCSLALQTIPISRNMPSSLAPYFEDPNRFLQLYRKISKFQCAQRASDNLGFWRKMQKQKDMELQLKGFRKLEANFNQQINVEKMRITQLREYISYHEQEGQKTRRRTIDNDRELRSTQNCRRPRTPCFSTSDITDESIRVSSCLGSDMDFQKHQKHNKDTNKTSGDSDVNV